MQLEKILEILSYTIPSVVTGAVAYFFFVKHVTHEENRRRFYLHKENQKHSFPIRLQAYERMVLFLERINPNQLILREHPKSNEKEAYLNQLVEIIENEFEHNLSQQIYMSKRCWDIIKTAKNATIQLIRNQSAKTEVNSSNELQKSILKEGLNETFPSTDAIIFIKTEVSDLF
jgi:hypothetical protein